jgi:hypothetical protein
MTRRLSVRPGSRDKIKPQTGSCIHGCDRNAGRMQNVRTLRSKLRALDRVAITILPGLRCVLRSLCRAECRARERILRETEEKNRPKTGKREIRSQARSGVIPRRGRRRTARSGLTAGHMILGNRSREIQAFHPIGKPGKLAEGFSSGLDRVIPSKSAKSPFPTKNSFAAKLREWVQNGRTPSALRDPTPYPLSG